MQSGIAWVTGVGGFLGTAVAEALVSRGWRVVAFGHRAASPSLAGLTTGTGCLADAVAGDITEGVVIDAVRRHGRPALVVHAAGGSHVGRAEQEPELDFRRTVQTTGELVHALGRAGLSDTHVVYPSSAALYGRQPAGPIPTDTPPAPVSQYGWHKLLAETVCRQGAERYGIRFSVIRFFSLYGAGLRKQLFWELGNRLLQGATRLELAGTGDETRDFLSVSDAVALILALHDRQCAGLSIVNGGSGTPTSIATAIATLQAALGTEVPVVFTGEVRSHDPRHQCAALPVLDWMPSTTLDRGLTAYATWLKGLAAGPSPAACLQVGG
ncbi:UDP-glucose 4-epimerase [Azospirillum oryzae]|uniref:UDP-glucose 4-epimerase n=1 Tax=Azospirillum oryzae TaxID=286727 RepID=A0A1X7EXK6_9PROT|nr:NAD(P)-dependent oxidoreductase [Azospirillum oryzae]SMF42166.1 UDP-glucose 4-epimerase [Azospirillum oryzae]